jgi:uncharacterized membrane protein
MNFLKTTLLRGLFVLLPLMLLFLGIKEIASLLVALAEPIADLIPGHLFEKLAVPGVIATLLIVTTALLLGLIANFSWVSRLGRHIEDSVLYRVPMYRMLKIMSSALIESESSSVESALMPDGSGGSVPCYVIEKHKDGRATILVPWSPASFAGNIKIVQQSELEMLSCSLDEFSRSISQMGVGIEDCLAVKPAGKE